MSNIKITIWEVRVFIVAACLPTGHIHQIQERCWKTQQKFYTAKFAIFHCKTLLYKMNVKLQFHLEVDSFPNFWFHRYASNQTCINSIIIFFKCWFKGKFHIYWFVLRLDKQICLDLKSTHPENVLEKWCYFRGAILLPSQRCLLTSSRNILL